MPESASMLGPHVTYDRHGPASPYPEVPSMTRSGLTRRSSSYPSPSLSITPAVLFSTTTSQRATRRRQSSTAFGWLRSSAMKRLPAFQSVNHGESCGWVPSSGAHGGTYRRTTSGCWRDSTRMTSAPHAAMNRPIHGPAIAAVSSRTRRPASAPAPLGVVESRHDRITLRSPGRRRSPSSNLRPVDVLIVLADGRRRSADAPRRLPESIRWTGIAQNASVPVLDVDEEAARREMRVARHRRRGVDGREREMAALTFAVDVGDGEARRQLGDPGVDDVARGLPIGRRTLEHGIAGGVVAGHLVNPLRQRLPVQRPVDHQIDQAVPAPIRARRNRGEERGAAPARDDAVVEPLADAADVRRRHRRLLERHVDVLSLAGTGAVEERDHAAGGRVHRRRHARLMTRESHRRVVGVAGHVHRAPERGGDQIGRRELAAWTRLAEARDRGEHESGVGESKIARSRARDCRDSPARTSRARCQRCSPDV